MEAVCWSLAAVLAFSGFLYGVVTSRPRGSVTVEDWHRMLAARRAGKRGA